MKNEESKRKGRGSKLVRSETVTIRLDPKLRYLAELAARKQRRTLSSFIEWAIEESLTRVMLGQRAWSFSASEVSVMDAAPHLWDVDEADRFAKLAIEFPDLLNHEEQILWKLIAENGYLWRGFYTNGEWDWWKRQQSIIFQRLRNHWETFNNVAFGNAVKETLPKWFEREEDETDSVTNLRDQVPLVPNEFEL